MITISQLKTFFAVLIIFIISSPAYAVPVAESGDTNIISHTFTGLTGRVTGSLISANDSIQSNQALASVRTHRLHSDHAPTLWTKPQLVVKAVATNSDTVAAGTTGGGLVTVQNVGDSTARVDTASFHYVHENQGVVDSFYSDTPTSTPNVPGHDTGSIALDVSVDSDADTGSVTVSSSVGASGQYTGVNAGSRGKGGSEVWTVEAGATDLIYRADTTALVGSVQPGDTIEYTITITNNGPNTAKDVRVYGAIPEDLTYVPGSLLLNNTLSGSKLEADAYDAEKTGPFDGSDDTSVVRFRAHLDVIGPSEVVKVTFQGVID